MQGTKLITEALTGNDFVNVQINGRMYSIFPPTIERLVHAAFYITDFADAKTIGDMIRSIKDLDKLAHALSWLIKGDDSLYKELQRGTFDELVEGVCAAYSLISLEGFSRLSNLAKNVSSLIAKPKL